MPVDEDSWQIGRKDIHDSIGLAGNSAPGPDGLPCAVWKASGDLAENVLLDVVVALQTDQAADWLTSMHGHFLPPEGHAFNHGHLICLGKTPSRSDHEHGNVFAASNTRPLSVVNTDNRLIANAARLKWERFLNGWISPQQQGFLWN